ncbi:MAG: hypothetical protein JXA42_22965 [Anaerolineales bacterium]|nr:hypothetical protein [Anaerolineales bacterium]
MSVSEILIIDVSGGPLERGRQQGEGARSQIVSMLALYNTILPRQTNMTWPQILNQARKYLPYSEQNFPDYVLELRGIAKGANVSFEDVWSLNCGEELTDGECPWGCTCAALSNDGGHVLVAHNEDWLCYDRDHVYLVRSRPDNGPAFLGLTYGPLLVNVGLNEAGITTAINSVYPTDGRVGVPRIIYSRAILASRTIGQAIRACVHPQRAGGYHFLLADDNGEIYSIETSATTHEIVYGDKGWLAHTNHYLSPKLQQLQIKGAYAGSNVRLNRINRLIRNLSAPATVEDLQTMLQDHVNYPDSICSHPDPADPEHERGQTVASLVMDLTDRVMWAAPGTPCEHAFSRHRL